MIAVTVIAVIVCLLLHLAGLRPRLAAYGWPGALAVDGDLSVVFSPAESASLPCAMRAR